MVNAILASNPRFSSPEGAPFCLHFTSLFIFFAILNHIFPNEILQ
ncbi:hypothetical protein LEP1GSC082_1379 [Leptospira kirschneri str. H2]|nr:hypothetical protein LEP1GSC082_1379 [Leptospira kirschneri str. H2]